MTQLVLVTGAGHGLGRSVAECLAERGARIGVLDVDDVAAKDVAGSLPDGVPLAADVSSEREVVAAFDTLGGIPDAVVCNAGIVRFGPLNDLTLADWQAVVDVNLTGTFLVAREAARRMIEAGRPGAIVTIGSMNGVAPGPNAGAYGSTKAGISLLTHQMALEWGPAGIRVNCVAPGLIDAGMSTPIYADPDFRERRESKVPLGRLGRPEDVSMAVAWLVSSESDYITGQTLLVDGGVTMSAIANLPRPAEVDRVGLGEGTP